MQSEPKHIYKMTADRTGKSEQMYKDLGGFIFHETAQMLKKPESLILKLKGLGSWHLRKKRMEIAVRDWADAPLKEPDKFLTNSLYLNYLEKMGQYQIFKERLKEYENYLSVKKEIRLKRNETAVLLEPDKGEDEGSESS